jgi:hypothetical protein
MGTGASWAFIIVLLPISELVRGYCIAKTWGWFIHPITGWREISTAEGVGISLFLSFLLTRTADTESIFKDKTPEEATLILVGKVFGVIAGPLMVLGLAWLWYTFLILPNSN